MRIFAFTFRPGKNGGADAEDSRIAELLGEAARRSRARQMRLAIENVSGSYVATGADAARLLKLIKGAAIGLTWDPNNAGISGEKAFPDGYQLLARARILQVHLRDYQRGADGNTEWCAVGQANSTTWAKSAPSCAANIQASLPWKPTIAARGAKPTPCAPLSPCCCS